MIVIIHNHSRHCKQGLKLQDKRIYSHDTDVVFVGDRITSEQIRIKAIVTKILADGRIECKDDKNKLHTCHVETVSNDSVPRSAEVSVDLLIILKKKLVAHTNMWLKFNLFYHISHK